MKNARLYIAGEIVFSDVPGLTMRKWREIFQINQSELAAHLNISPSTISDYEAGRRSSPGIKMIKKYVNALFDIDAERGSPISKNLNEEQENKCFERQNFMRPITIGEFIKLIDGKRMNEAGNDNDKIYGYTLLDSLRIILDMPYDDFPKLYGGISDRAFIFLSVSTGRSPLVVIRVAPTKPKVVVLHNLDKVDSLALKIAERMNIPIVVTKLDINELKKRLSI